ncbi:hypothetical protein BS50DRAFT_193558 [Corynespora cassiicola Philippines]|uniref:Nuclear fusion protein KAR5 n=1 Tax=Corynespora cassiicola Philippines TaxID=1448308 RepID=A0A2T2P7R1_CORCC|nr:hypothetical protein BS50DRAFT_193558 [Corynespora cassiicola Philippines]
MAMTARNIRASQILGRLALFLLCAFTTGQASSPESVVPTRLASLLEYPPVETPAVLAKALEVIRELESRPSCYRYAAMNLINDCKDLEKDPGNDGKDTETSLDYLKEQYAARNAVCELRNALFPIPKECSILTPSVEACRDWGRWNGLFGRTKTVDVDGEPCYPEHSRAKFQSCLKALSKTGPSWTSYSNSKQNAVLMCQASRNALERDRDLAAYKNFTQIIQHLQRILSHEVHQWKASSSEQMEFMKNAATLQESITADMRTTQSELHEMKSILKDLQKEPIQAKYQFHAALETLRRDTAAMVQENFRTASDTYELQVKHLHEQVSLTKDAVIHNFDTALKAIYQSFYDKFGSVNTEIESLHSAVDAARDRATNAEIIAAATERKVIATDRIVDSILDRVLSLNDTLGNLQGQLPIATMASLPHLAKAMGIILLVAGNIAGLFIVNRKAAGWALVASSITGLSYQCGLYESVRDILVHKIHSDTLSRYSYPANDHEGPSPSYLFALVVIFAVLAVFFVFKDDLREHNSTVDQLEDTVNEQQVNTSGTQDPGTRQHRLRSFFFRAFR